MTCIKEVVCNGQLVNTIKTTGANAYKELSILLINVVNKNRASVSNLINKKGLHEIQGLQKINNEFVYQYHFKGDELERLPIICN